MAPAAASRLVGAPAGAPVRARLLVAADGVHSTVAHRLGLQVTGGMRKIALVAHLRGVAGLGEYVEVHVARGRYVGVAPLERAADGDLCNVALVVDEARDGRRLAGRPEEYLLEALTSFPGLRTRVAMVSVARHTLAISRLHTRVRRVSDDRLLLIGDAAGYYDPFTGEGIAKALRTAQIARDVALAALREHDLGTASLARYDRALRRAVRGKRTVERMIQLAVRYPPMMNHIARRMAHHKALADTVVAVTGDILPASAVLRPGYLLRLLA
jgi:flavin-dependent dehydrogenase